MLTLNADFFAVKTIEVTGCCNLTPVQVISYSGIKAGEHILVVNKNAAVENLKKTPWIISAKVTTRLPSKVLIEIEENTPAAIVPYMGSLLVIDKDAVVLKISDKQDVITIPVITGLDLGLPAVGRVIETKNTTDIQILKPLLNAIDVNQLTSEISEVNVKDIDNITIYFLGGIEARVGDVLEINKKLSKIPFILEDIRKNHRSGGYIDLKTGNDPIYRKKN